MGPRVPVAQAVDDETPGLARDGLVRLPGGGTPGRAATSDASRATLALGAAIGARMDKTEQSMKQSLGEAAGSLAALVGEMYGKIDRALARNGC